MKTFLINTVYLNTFDTCSLFDTQRQDALLLNYLHDKTISDVQVGMADIELFIKGELQNALDEILPSLQQVAANRAAWYQLSNDKKTRNTVAGNNLNRELQAFIEPAKKSHQTDLRNINNIVSRHFITKKANTLTVDDCALDCRGRLDIQATINRIVANKDFKRTTLANIDNVHNFNFGFLESRWQIYISNNVIKWDFPSAGEDQFVVLKYIWSRSSANERHDVLFRFYSDIDMTAFQWAIQTSNVLVAQWLWEQYDPQQKQSFFDDAQLRHQYLRSAVLSDNQLMFEWWVSQSNFTVEEVLAVIEMKPAWRSCILFSILDKIDNAALFNKIAENNFDFITQAIMLANNRFLNLILDRLDTTAKTKLMAFLHDVNLTTVLDMLKMPVHISKTIKTFFCLWSNFTIKQRDNLIQHNAHELIKILVKKGDALSLEQFWKACSFEQQIRIKWVTWNKPHFKKFAIQSVPKEYIKPYYWDALSKAIKIILSVVIALAAPISIPIFLVTLGLQRRTIAKHYATERSQLSSSLPATLKSSASVIANEGGVEVNHPVLVP